MAECYIRAIKVQGEIVALALTRWEETRGRDYSRYWNERLRLICLYPPKTPPAQIRTDARRNWGYSYYDEDTKWADPVLIPSNDWPMDDGKPIPLKASTQYWPS